MPFHCRIFVSFAFFVGHIYQRLFILYLSDISHLKRFAGAVLL